MNELGEDEELAVSLLHIPVDYYYYNNGQSALESKRIMESTKSLEVVRTRWEKWALISAYITGLVGIGAGEMLLPMSYVKSDWTALISFLLVGSSVARLLGAFGLVMPSCLCVGGTLDEEISSDSRRAASAVLAAVNHEIWWLRFSMTCTLVGLWTCVIGVGLSWIARSEKNGE